MDRKLVAQKLREHLERRLSSALGCQREDFSKTKLGTLLHLCFLVHGDQECLSGFTTCIRGVLDLVGHEIVWADPTDESESEQAKDVKVVVN